MKTVLFALYVTFVNPQTGQVTKVEAVHGKTYNSYLKCHIDKSYYTNSEFIYYSCEKIEKN